MASHPALSPAPVLAAEQQSRPCAYLFQTRVSGDRPPRQTAGGSWQAAGPRGAPASGRAAPHPSQRRSGRPAIAWLWHGASQEVAPMRAMSCEAAPRLGVTISPATQSKEKNIAFKL